jgi:tripartite-type tricarboxylate transporter receptor subunit TctC
MRILAQEGGKTYALMQLSNGDKLNLTRGEFTAVTGEDPRPLVRLRQKP